jgi:4-amino-4-deoxy-L-arabinose transferase-like glycosyltransferase
MDARLRGRLPLLLLGGAVVLGSLPRIDAVSRFYPPDRDQRTDAQRYYISMAESARAGRGWIPSYPTNFIPPPGQALFIFVLKSCWPRSDFQHLRTVQAVVSIATIVLAYGLGRALHDAWTGAACAGMVAFHYKLSEMVGVLLPETNHVFLLFAFVIALAAALERRTRWTCAAAGTLLGLACLFKPTPLLLAPIVCAALWKGGGGKPPLAFAACFLAVLAPWTVRNWRHYGGLYPISTNGGTLLALANSRALDSSRADMTYWDDLYRLDYYKDAEVEARYAGRVDADGKPEENLKDRDYAGVAIRYMASHPLHFLRNYAYKTCNFIVYPPPESGGSWSFPFREAPWLTRLVIGAGLIGAALLLVLRRRQPSAQATLLTLVSLLAVGALLHLTRDGRMNLPFRALLSAPASFALVFGAQSGWRVVRERRAARQPAAAPAVAPFV